LKKSVRTGGILDARGNGGGTGFRSGAITGGMFPVTDGLRSSSLMICPAAKRRLVLSV